VNIVRNILLSAFLAIVLMASPTRVSAQATDSGGKIDLTQIAAQADKKYSDEVANSPEGRFEAWQDDFEQRSWEWHLLTTKIIFAVVLLVVVFGLVVSWLQFRSDILPKTGDGKTDGPGDPAYDIKADFQSVSIKTKTIGAVVLIFSGVFFFLYLSIVYPMTGLVAKDWKAGTEKAVTK
jgi:hypothetical protein